MALIISQQQNLRPSAPCHKLSSSTKGGPTAIKIRLRYEEPRPPHLPPSRLFPPQTPSARLPYGACRRAPFSIPINELLRVKAGLPLLSPAPSTSKGKESLFPIARLCSRAMAAVALTSPPLSPGSAAKATPAIAPGSSYTKTLRMGELARPWPDAWMGRSVDR